MIRNILLGASALALLPVVGVQQAVAQQKAKPTDPAAIFGEREDVQQISLSPSGTKVAFIAPGPGPSSVLYVSDSAGGSAPTVALSADGKPKRLRSCFWVSDSRLVCNVDMVFHAENGVLADATRTAAVDVDGKNLKALSNDTRPGDAYVSLDGGRVIDELPDESGAVLMERAYVPEERQATHLNDTREGFGVDRLDTNSLAYREVEPPRRDAVEYISDGRGKIRIMGTQETSDSTGYDKSTITYYYRTTDSKGWKQLSVHNLSTREGFNPYAVDPTLNVVYGFERKDGRRALYSVALDGSKKEELVFARPDVDVDGLVRIGRQRRVVGVTYSTDKSHVVYFDKPLEALAASLSKALPGLPLIEFVDSSVDESKILLWAGSDTDPGRYYLFDKATRHLNELMLSRADLEGAKLAEQKPVTFKAADGTVIPAYLTLPPGSSGRNLPAIVMPHGGPASRDEWGFDWMVQFFAARGYAVLQPEFRGSAGYGDDFFLKNGFQSWRTSIGDVDDAGRWLVSQGIADPNKLAIFGWSYGGYAALQANVIDPKLFKAAVAVAPVTDLASLLDESREYTNFPIVRDMIGSGPQIREGSPAQNADRIVAPVLLFHGDLDMNVNIHESKLMNDKLKEAGKQVQLVVYPGLDHQLRDGDVRADLLRKTDEFLRSSLKM